MPFEVDNLLNENSSDDKSGGRGRRRRQRRKPHGQRRAQWSLICMNTDKQALQRSAGSGEDSDRRKDYPGHGRGSKPKSARRRRRKAAKPSSTS